MYTRRPDEEINSLISKRFTSSVQTNITKRAAESAAQNFSKNTPPVLSLPMLVLIFASMLCGHCREGQRERERRVLSSSPRAVILASLHPSIFKLSGIHRRARHQRRPIEHQRHPPIKQRIGECCHSVVKLNPWCSFLKATRVPARLGVLSECQCFYRPRTGALFSTSGKGRWKKYIAA